jgi:transcriptional regulator with XRE-family HTH domain
MRTRQSPGEGAEVGYGRGPPYAYGAIGEQLAGRDEQIGQIFRNMRSVMGVSRETIARRLATSPSTIDSFEAGAIAALPHWKETARIVRSYCELLRMDPEPTLRRIHDRLAALISPPRTANPPAPRVLRSVRSVRTAPPVAQVQPARAHPVSRRRRARTLFALSAPIGLLVGVAILAQAMPGPVYRVVGWLPGALESPLRAGLDYVVLLTAPRRDGLRWIEVGDPQLRKVDKLSTSPR